MPPNDPGLEGEQFVTHTQLSVFDLGPIVEEVRTRLSARTTFIAQMGRSLLNTAGVQAGLVNGIGNHYAEEDDGQSNSRDKAPQSTTRMEAWRRRRGTERRAIGDVGETARERRLRERRRGWERGREHTPAKFLRAGEGEALRTRAFDGGIGVRRSSPGNGVLHGS